MIKNERQYRITKSQLRKFDDAIQELEVERSPENLNLHSVYRSALRSQYEELTAEVNEYEMLKSGMISSFETESLSQLPEILIKARIARNLTHSDLAAKLKVKEQQIQRWESTDYSGVSISTLLKAMEVLGVFTRETIYIPDARLTCSVFLEKLFDLGLPKNLLMGRILPRQVWDTANHAIAVETGDILRAASTISRIFGQSIDSLLSITKTNSSLPCAQGVRFKLPSKQNSNSINAYAVYAHYLACIVANSYSHTAKSTLPTDWHHIFKLTTKPGQPMTLGSVIELCWNVGIIVIPLREPASFHGAVFKISDRFVVFLNQNTILESRWLYDLLHELGHIASGHITEDIALIEEEPISEQSADNDEVEANEWAQNALFDGDIEHIEQACVYACRSNIRHLKRVLPEIAKEFNVNMGSLANHMAYRMQEDKESWWGTAHALQKDLADPYALVRTHLIQRINLRLLNEFDRELLLRALTEN